MDAKKMDNEPLIVERVLNAPVARVWKALTDKNEMKQWYFDLAEFIPQVGFKFQFTGKGEKGESYVHLCEITEVVFQKKLTYSWRYQGLKGNSFVTFELSDKDGQTILKLTHEGINTFPAGNPDFAIESFTAGWTELIGTLLKDFVEK